MRDRAYPDLWRTLTGHRRPRQCDLNSAKKGARSKSLARTMRTPAAPRSALNRNTGGAAASHEAVAPRKLQKAAAPPTGAHPIQRFFSRAPEFTAFSEKPEKIGGSPAIGSGPPFRDDHRASFHEVAAVMVASASKRVRSRSLLRCELPGWRAHEAGSSRSPAGRRVRRTEGAKAPSVQHAQGAP